MTKQIIGEVRDTSDRYVARAVTEERAIMPGYQFYVEIQKEGSPTIKKVEVGKMSAGILGLVTYPPTYNGVAGIKDMRFDENGLTIDFLIGLWGAGLDGLLSRKQRFVPRASFA